MDKFAYNLGVKAAQDNFPVFDPETVSFKPGKAPEVAPTLDRTPIKPYISPYRPKTQRTSGGIAGGMAQKYYDWLEGGEYGQNPRTAKAPDPVELPKSLRAYPNVPDWTDPEVGGSSAELANPWKINRTHDPSGTLTNTPANEQSLYNTMLDLQRRWMDAKLGKGKFSAEDQAQMDALRDQIMPTRQKERQKYWDKKLIKNTGGQSKGHWYTKIPGEKGVYSPIK